MKEYKLYLKSIGVIISWMQYTITNSIKIKETIWFFKNKTKKPYFCYYSSNNFIELINSIKDYEFLTDHYDYDNNEFYDGNMIADMITIADPYVILDEEMAFYIKLKYGVEIFEKV